MSLAQDKNKLLARLDRLPVWPYPYALLFVMGAGFFFAFFDIVTVGLGLPVFIKQFNTTLSVALWAITSSLIGYIIGALCDGWVSDRFGRKVALTLSVIFVSAGSLLSASSSSIESLIVWRFFIGMGIGAEISNVVTYIAELSPAKIRGKYTAIPISMAFFAFAIAPFIAYLLIPNFSWGWRALFVLGALGGMILLWMRRKMPESIRWLLSQNRFDEANKILLEAESLVKERTGKALPEPDVFDYGALTEKARLVDTLKNNIKPLLLFTFIWFFYYIGNYAWLTLSTKLFILAGYKLSNSIIIVGVSSIGFVVGSMLAIFYGDKFERRNFSIALAFIWGIFLLIIGFGHSETMILIFGFLSACSISLIIPMLYIYTSEQFETKSRATCMSITDGIGHLGGAFCGQYTFFFYDAFKNSGAGIEVAFSALAFTGFVTALLLCFGRKMTGRALT